MCNECPSVFVPKLSKNVPGFEPLNYFSDADEEFHGPTSSNYLKTKT